MNKSRDSDSIFYFVEWKGRDIEWKSSVLVTAESNWATIVKVIDSLATRSIGLTRWGFGQWRMLFSTCDLALFCISLKYISYKRINLLVCGIKKKRAQVLKVLFLLTTKEEVEAALAAAFKSNMYEIHELLSNGLRSGRWLVSTDYLFISFVFDNHLYKVELSRS